MGLTFMTSAGQAQQSPDRSRPPELRPAHALALPALQHFTLSNGLRVVLMEKHSVPLVHINLVVKAGPLNDPPPKRGLATVTLDMLMAGSGSRDAVAIAEATALLGASITPGTRLNIANVELHTPVAKLDEALSLMAEVVLRPAFPGAELERLRQQRLTDLVLARNSPGQLERNAFARALYGETHPYGVQTTVERGLRAIGEQDLRAFHMTYFRPNNATVIVAGAVTPEVILPKLEQAYGDWEARPIPETHIEEPKQVEGRVIYLVDTPGAPQSSIRLARLGVTRATDGYFARVVMNAVLSSRLYENLRVDKGYTYNARSEYPGLGGVFFAASTIRADATGPAISEFMRELRAIREPVPEEELERTKTSLALPYGRRFETVQTVTQEIEPLVFFGLPESQLYDYAKHIHAVTQDAVLRAAREHVDPDNIAIIIIGDRAVVEEQVQALDLGPIQVLSVDDVLGPVPLLDTESR